MLGSGVSAFAHVASDVSLSPNPNDVIPPVIAFTRNALASANKEAGLKSFVLTSSSAATSTARPGQNFHIDATRWNEEAVKAAWAPPP